MAPLCASSRSLRLLPALLHALAQLPRRALAFEPLRMAMPGHLDADRLGRSPSYRRNFCHLEHGLRNGTTKLRDALRGERISVFIQPGQSSDWSYEFEEPAPGQAVPPASERTYTGGFQLELLEEVAKRAGFDWRTQFVASDGRVQGESWDEYADYWLDRYDLAINWFVESSRRKRLSMVFPHNWFDSNVILYTRVTQDKPTTFQRFFSFLGPFSGGLWACILGAIAISAGVYWLLEGEGNSDEFKQESLVDKIIHSLFLSAAEFTTSTSYTPVSRLGKVFSASWAFVTLLLASAYTANLASYMVVTQKEIRQIDSIESAVAQGAPICCPADAMVICRAVEDIYHNVKLVFPENPLEGMRRVREGSCKAGLSVVSDWQMLEVGAGNSDCDLQWVGRTIRNFQAGWVGRADYANEHCSQVLTEVVGLHLLEMDEEGVIRDLWQRRLRSLTANDCMLRSEAASEDTVATLTATDLGGLLLLHAALAAACVLINLGQRTRRWRRGGQFAASTPPEAEAGQMGDSNAVWQLQKRLDETDMKVQEILSRVRSPGCMVEC